MLEGAWKYISYVDSTHSRKSAWTADQMETMQDWLTYIISLAVVNYEIVSLHSINEINKQKVKKCHTRAQEQNHRWLTRRCPARQSE